MMLLGHRINNRTIENELLLFAESVNWLGRKVLACYTLSHIYDWWLFCGWKQEIMCVRSLNGNLL